MRVYTIGHSNRAWVEFAALLEAHAIEVVADVRTYPGSRRHPQFARAQFERELPGIGVRYVWLGRELGGMRDYDAHRKTALFREGVERLLEAARTAKVACMCAEKLPDRCHRRWLSDELLARGVEVLHVLDKETVVAHEPTETPRDDRQQTFF